MVTPLQELIHLVFYRVNPLKFETQVEHTNHDRTGKVHKYQSRQETHMRSISYLDISICVKLRGPQERKRAYLKDVAGVALAPKSYRSRVSLAFSVGRHINRTRLPEYLNRQSSYVERTILRTVAPNVNQIRPSHKSRREVNHDRLHRLYEFCCP